jgi:hypothetical protein
MTAAELYLARIEAIIAEIEVEHSPELAQPEDREAFDIVCRLERKMLTKKIKHD